MRRADLRLCAIAAIGVSLSGACTKPTPVTAAAPIAWPPEQHCWWSAFRTTLPPDSIAARFARALAPFELGLATSGSRADTTWAEAGPRASSRFATPGTYAARVVAFRRGDSTYFRAFVATPRNESSERSEGIPFCGELMRTAKLGGLAPRDEEPEDSLPLWRRRP